MGVSAIEEKLVKCLTKSLASLGKRPARTADDFEASVKRFVKSLLPNMTIRASSFWPFARNGPYCQTKTGHIAKQKRAILPIIGGRMHEMILHRKALHDVWKTFSGRIPTAYCRCTAHEPSPQFRRCPYKRTKMVWKDLNGQTCIQEPSLPARSR